MLYHCRSFPWRKGCGSFLKFTETHDEFLCRCPRCGWETRQKRTVWMAEAKVVEVGDRISHGMVV